MLGRRDGKTWSQSQHEEIQSIAFHAAHYATSARASQEVFGKVTVFYALPCR